MFSPRADIADYTVQPVDADPEFLCRRDHSSNSGDHLIGNIQSGEGFQLLHPLEDALQDDLLHSFPIENRLLENISFFREHAIKESYLLWRDVRQVSKKGMTAAA